MIENRCDSAVWRGVIGGGVGWLVVSWRRVGGGLEVVLRAAGVLVGG